MLKPKVAKVFGDHVTPVHVWPSPQLSSVEALALAKLSTVYLLIDVLKFSATVTVCFSPATFTESTAFTQKSMAFIMFFTLALVLCLCRRMKKMVKSLSHFNLTTYNLKVTGNKSRYLVLEII